MAEKVGDALKVRRVERAEREGRVAAILDGAHLSELAERYPHELSGGQLRRVALARMGHPVLRTPAAAIDDPTAPWVRRLVEDMVETMEDAGGAARLTGQEFGRFVGLSGGSNSGFDDAARRFHRMPPHFWRSARLRWHAGSKLAVREPNSRF